MSDGKVVFDITGNTAGIDKALQAATSSISRETAKWTVIGQTAMNGLTSAASAAFRGIAALAKNAFSYNAQMETYLINFSTLLGDAEAGAAKLEELKIYAAQTPFVLSDLAKATQTMLSFGIASDTVSDALRYMGDISLGDAQKLQSLALAFSQATSTGKLMGQDLLQMINAGFNPLMILAEAAGEAYSDFKRFASGDAVDADFALRVDTARSELERLGDQADLTTRILGRMGQTGEVSADLILLAMQLATSEGGLFFDALTKSSKTATGQLSTIADSWDMLIGKIGKGGFDYLSTKLFPKLILWLDELNAAIDENGIQGMADALPGILSQAKVELVNVVSAIVAAIYNAFTGKTLDQSEVREAINGALTSIGETLAAVGVFFSEQLPATWAKVQAIIDKVCDMLNLKVETPRNAASAPDPFYDFDGWSEYDIAAAIDYIRAYAQVRKGNKEYTDMMVKAMQAINEGQKDDAASFATAVDELFSSIENGDPVQIPAEWLDGTEADLQSALSGMDLSADVSVNPVYASGAAGSIADLFGAIAGLFGQDHAAGGVFAGSTRLLARDGSLHTVGESGAEAILPLDTLWRRLGLLMDGAFAANLGDMQYRVMPSIPAAAPSAGMDETVLSSIIADKVREAISGLVIEMDHQRVAKLLTPSVSRNVADEIKQRKWTG